MKALVRRVAESMPGGVSVEEIDISTDPELSARYGLEIPVLLVDGQKAAKYRVTERELRAIVAGRRPEGDGGTQRLD